MISYNLGISGSWLVLILLIVVAIGFTVFTYLRTNPPINRAKKAFLTALRSIALCLLIFALFEPVFTGYKSSVIAPKIAVLFDNSASMAMNDVGGNRKEKYLQSIINSKISDVDENDIFYRSFGSNVKYYDNFSSDSLSFNDNSTNLTDAIRSVNNLKNEDNLRALVVFTDGSFNSGANPVYSAEELSVPIFTIGIGDTNEPKDVSIQSIILNEIAYVDNPVPVNVNIKSSGFNNIDLNVSIYDNNKLLESLIIKPDNDIYEGTVYFTYIPKEDGNRKITVKIDELEGEITYKNNSGSEFVKVLKNKRVISIFGGAPSPDISFMKQFLKTLPGIEIREFIQSSGSSFFKQATENDISETELFVLIGFPIQSTPDNILEKISKELANGKPIFLITSLNLDFVKLRKIEEFLPFNTASSRAMEFSIIPDFTVKGASSPMLRVDGSSNDIDKWKNLPPLFRTETFVRPKPESEVIATFKVNNVPLNEPFIISRNVNSRKSLAIIGYGLNRWKLVGYASEEAKGKQDNFDAYTKLMDNSFRWLSVSDLNRKIRINTTKKFYPKGERIEFVGQVYDASYLPVDNASVNIAVIGSDETRELVMVSVGAGRYVASLDGLNSGDFSYNAIINRDGNKIGTDNGRFTVGETELEYRNLKMEANLLRMLSESSGGKFYSNENTASLINDIKALNSFREIPQTKRNDFTLWNYPWLLAIAILLFAIEWIIRKRTGML